MRRMTLAGGGVVLVAGPTALAFFSGGYFDDPRIVAGAAAWALAALAAVCAPKPLPRSTAGRVALISLALLAVWTLASVGWAPLGERAEDDAQRLLLYLGAFAAAIALLDQDWLRRWLEPLIAAGALVVVVYGLSERLLPGLITLNRSLTSEGRLELPLTYWNAEGALAAIGLILAIRIAGDPERERALRGSAAAGGVVLGLGVYLTFSRGALAALAAGVIVLLAFAPAGMEQLRAVGGVLGAALLAVAATGLLPTVRSLERSVEGDPLEGIVMLVVLALTGLMASQLAVARADRPGRHVRSLPIARNRLVVGAAIVAVLGGIAAIVAVEGQPGNESPARDANPARFRSIDTNRYDYWDTAISMFADKPLTGHGSGAFMVEWRKRSDRVDPAVDAHSLYLETPAELGLVGLALLLGFLGGVTACGVRLLRDHPAAAVGPLAVCAAWALHAGLDWDWEMPAVTLPALILAAALVTWSEPKPPSRVPRADPTELVADAENGHGKVREPASDLLRSA